MKRLEQIVAGAHSVALSGHVRPDGDCVGSCLAVYNYIRENFPEISVTVYLQEIPNIFKFLKHADQIVHDCSQEHKYDLFIALDCGDLGRLGDAAEYFRTAERTFCVDHHKSNVSFADENDIHPEASSTSELVYELMDPDKISKEVAECIYLGIVHDTGVFQYSCTSSKTMSIAGALMDRGIDYSAIINDTFFAKTFEQNRILGHALLKARRYMEDRCIYTCITKEEMEQFHVLPKHLEGIVSQLRATKDVEVAVFLYQSDAEDFKVSMRSGNLVDVSEIAVKYGGGGHAKAAGVTMKGTEEEIRDLILADIASVLENV